MLPGVGSFSCISLLKHSWIGLFDHLLAEVNADQVLLEDIVVEHVFRRFTQVDDPLTERRWLYPIGHILSIDGAGCVVVSANTTDATGDEVGVARVFALHEEAVAAKDVRTAIGLHYFALLKIDLGIDAQAANDACHRVPRHFHKLWGLSWSLFSCRLRCHETISLLLWLPGRPRDRPYPIRWPLPSPRWAVAGGEFPARVPPGRFFVDGVVGQLT